MGSLIAKDDCKINNTVGDPSIVSAESKTSKASDVVPKEDKKLIVASTDNSKVGQNFGELNDSRSPESSVGNDRNAAWKAMLKKESDKLKKMKRKRGGQSLIEAEAE